MFEMSKGIANEQGPWAPQMGFREKDGTLQDNGLASMSYTASNFTSPTLAHRTACVGNPTSLTTSSEHELFV